MTTKLKQANEGIRFFVNNLTTGLTVLKDDKICYMQDHKPYMVPVSYSKKSTEKEVYVLDEDLPLGNIWVYNPFNGSIMESNVDRAMYSAYRISTSVKIYKIIMNLLYSAVLSKDIEVEDENLKFAELDCKHKYIIDLFSKKSFDNNKILIDEIDLKALEEIQAYFKHDIKNQTELVVADYNKQTKVCSLVVNILKDDFIKNEYPFPFRKKSIYILRNLVYHLLCMEKQDKRYEVFAKEKTPFKFYSTMKVYFNIYESLAEIIDIINDTIEDPLMTLPDMEEFQTHLDKMDMYKRVTQQLVYAAPVDSGLDPKAVEPRRDPSRQPNKRQYENDDPPIYRPAPAPRDNRVYPTAPARASFVGFGSNLPYREQPMYERNGDDVLYRPDSDNSRNRPTYRQDYRTTQRGASPRGSFIGFNNVRSFSR